MTNKNILDLTAATTPLVGTELVPVWDGTGTKKVTVAKILTPAAGRAVRSARLRSPAAHHARATDVHWLRHCSHHHVASHHHDRADC